MQYGIENLAERKGYFLGGLLKPVRKVINKVVPRELQPVLPMVASAFLGPAVGGMFSSLGPAAAGFLGAGTTSAVTQALTGSGEIDPTSTLLSAGIGGIQGARVPNKFTDTTAATMPGQGGTGLMPGQGPNVGRTIFAQPGTEDYKQAMNQSRFFDKALMTAKEYTGSLNLDPETGKFAGFERGPASFFKGATAFSLPYTAKAAAEEAIDLEKAEGLANMESAAQKRKERKIYIDFVMKAGFSQEEAERMADGAGYEEGGEVTKEKRMTANTGEFAGLETLMLINDATGFPEIRPAIDPEYPEASEENADVERMERLGREKFVSSGDTMKILDFFRKNPEAEEQYKNDLGRYIEEGKGSNSFFDAILGMGFNEGGQVPGSPFNLQKILGSASSTQPSRSMPPHMDFLFPGIGGGLMQPQEPGIVGQIMNNVKSSLDNASSQIQENIRGSFKTQETLVPADGGQPQQQPAFFPPTTDHTPPNLSSFVDLFAKRSTMEMPAAMKEGGSMQMAGGKVPGLPEGKQVDAREGMFIPMGGAKRADDVPAMLSVNEFVLNDNAVAGLGKMLTGSPDPRAGARALYKIQDQLEAMVV